MTVYGLMREFEVRGVNPYFFSRDSLKFFGNRISEMRVLKRTAKITDYDGTDHECYVLSVLHRNHPRGIPTRGYYYFDTETFERIH